MGVAGEMVRPGDFAVLPVRGVTGRLIRLGEKLNGDAFTEFQHAEIFAGMPDSTAPMGYTLGAYPGGARLTPLPADMSGWLWSSGAIVPSRAQRDAIVRNALACRGVRYGWEDYFALAAHRLHLPAPGLEEFIGSSHSMICSQLVDWVLARSGVHLFADGRWPGYVTPAALGWVIRNPQGVTYD